MHFKINIGRCIFKFILQFSLKKKKHNLHNNYSHFYVMSTDEKTL